MWSYSSFPHESSCSFGFSAWADLNGNGPAVCLSGFSSQYYESALRNVMYVEDRFRNEPELVQLDGPDIHPLNGHPTLSLSSRYFVKTRSLPDWTSPSSPSPDLFPVDVSGVIPHDMCTSDDNEVRYYVRNQQGEDFRFVGHPTV